MADHTTRKPEDAAEQCLKAVLTAVTAFLEGRAAIEVSHNPDGFGVRFKQDPPR